MDSDVEDGTVDNWDVELWDEDIDVVPVPQTSLPMFKE